MTEIHLSPTQESLLKVAARCEDRAIRWPVTLRGGARTRIITALLAAGVAENRSGSLVITDAGMRAVGIEPGAHTKPATPKKDAGAKARRKKAAKVPKKSARGKSGRKAAAPRAARTDTKQAQVIAMLERAKGATIDEIAEVTGWQRHTVRGAMSGALKKKLGLKIDSEKVDGRGRVYRVIG